ncbi:MAG: TIGR02147 family protein [Bdellovibrionota bacterium]
MDLFKFQDYRSFLEEYFRSQGKGGRGQLSKVAKVLGVHSTFVSLVFQEKRDLSFEQAVLLAQHLQLTESETDYFLLLVQLARAGNSQLKEHTKKKIREAQEAAKKLSSRFEHEHQLGAEERQTFYSSWHYSAIRIFTLTKPQGRSIEEICERFSLPRSMVVAALQFLTRTQLVIQDHDKYQVGPQRTFLEKSHPLLKCHHGNWRLKALQQYERITDDEMMFTSTISLSRTDFSRLKEILTEFVKTTSQVIKETDPEDVACVNLDLFWIR